MPDKLKSLLQRELNVTELGEIPNRYAPQAYIFSCAGTEALSKWNALVSLVDRSGYWPVILGNDKEVERILEVSDSEFGMPVEEILERAASQSADEWLVSRGDGMGMQHENLRAMLEKTGANADQVIKQLASLKAAAAPSLHGRWPDHPEPMPSFTIPYEGVGSGKPKPKVSIGLFPTKNGWEVPAHLNFGGWNECPDSAAHVLMMKKWSEEYGAELVGMSGDIVEMQPTRPPNTREASLQLAEEQFRYCEDIVIQGTQTIENLAAGLMGSRIWFFWWD